MARAKANSFLKTIEVSCTDPRAIIEAMRIFGYINEVTYSELNTELTIMSTEMVRGDGAETIELARRQPSVQDIEEAYFTTADEIPGMIPREY